MANSSDSAHPGSSGAGGAAGTRTLTAPIASPTGVTLPWKPSERSRPEILTKSPSAAGLWDSFRRRWILASVLGLGAAVLAVGLLWFFLPAKYEAVASIHVSSTTPSVAFPTHDTDVESYKRTQLYQIKSRPVIDAALLESKLANNPFLKGIHDKATYLSSQLNVEFPLNSEIMKITLKADQKKDLDKVVNAVVNAYIQKVVQKEKTDKQKRREDMEKR